MDELERALDAWLRAHAPAHRDHHVQIGAHTVLCVTCGLVDLSDADQVTAATLVA
jgi:hypothetical protein